MYSKGNLSTSAIHFARVGPIITKKSLKLSDINCLLSAVLPSFSLIFYWHRSYLCLLMIFCLWWPMTSSCHLYGIPVDHHNNSFLPPGGHDSNYSCTVCIASHFQHMEFFYICDTIYSCALWMNAEPLAAMAFYLSTFFYHHLWRIFIVQVQQFVVKQIKRFLSVKSTAGFIPINFRNGL